MRHQTVLITAVSLAGLIVAGAGAAAANLGILGSTSTDVGQLSAAQPVPTPTTTAQTIEIVIEDLPTAEKTSNDPAAEVQATTTSARNTAKAPITVAPTPSPASTGVPANDVAEVDQSPAVPGPQVFDYAVGDAGSVRLQLETWTREGADALTRSEVHVETVAVAAGWATTELLDDGTSVSVSFGSGSTTLVFTADLVDGQIQAGVEEVITEPAPAGSGRYDDHDDGTGYYEDGHEYEDHDDDEDDDDDHDDGTGYYEDGHEYEGHDDDD